MMAQSYNDSIRGTKEKELQFNCQPRVPSKTVSPMKKEKSKGERKERGSKVRWE